jgi:hypothetical protein
LAQVTVGYLTGDVKDANFDHTIGELPPVVALPSGSTETEYALCRSARPQGPGPGVEVLGRVRRDGSNAKLESNQALVPGNYTLAGTDGKPAACFSLNGSPAECNLSRVPVEDIESLFGPGSVLALDKSQRLRDALQGPINLLPWLMAILVLFLLVENLLANRFYRGEKQGQEPARPPVPVVEEIPTVEPVRVGLP